MEQTKKKTAGIAKSTTTLAQTPTAVKPKEEVKEDPNEFYQQVGWLRENDSRRVSSHEFRWLQLVFKNQGINFNREE